MKPNFQPKNIVKTIEKLTRNGLKVVEKASLGTSWNSVVAATDQTALELDKFTSVNSHLNAVMFSDEFNQQYEKTLPIITNFYSNISTNKGLYQAYKTLKKTNLNKQQQHIVKDVIKSFELSGVDLEGNFAHRFKSIKKKLSLLSNEFSRNVLKSTNEWKKIVDKDELKGYSDNELEKIKTDKGYELSLQMPVYMDVMTYLDNRDLREEVYRAYVSRASELGITSTDYNNKPIMDEILSLRAEMANILGFEHYAQLSIMSKMVSTIDEVLQFLYNLVERSKPQAQLELEELKKLSGIDLKPWDFGFYSEKLKEQKFGFKKSDLTPYFPESSVLNGLFSTIENLYQIKIEKIQQDSYHVDVKVLNVSDKNGLIGRIYLDLYARRNKRSGAWMTDYQPLIEPHKPVAFVVCNLNSYTKDKPALFEFDEIVTLFHEFGHALHHLLTKVKYPCAAGISGVPWDGVELPSQYMEFYAFEKQVIALISKHYKTGQSLPDDLFNKLIASKNFHSALAMLRQCEFSLWDLKTHMSNSDTYEVLTQVRSETALMDSIDENRFLNTFGHIFSGSYAAGYFSYKWAEVLAADAYYYVQGEGGIGSNASKDFLYNILEIGGSLNFMQQYIKFRGKEPSINALLQANGIF
ncbi:Oligopeptidase A [Candidatus Ruthia magnifica str. Cm (Calyptogena magnifica)]|uniref:oligopeptidase A n=1 Tax=Ruthia magnifica subsp. Calyptogena magnifica TaxID=413404 RepID=A1AWL3_RUTMC|nr:M3 family metallopeptidase [Candidatus Ruthturnera calyptogenae]ABL02320.1 Oligopeptidase A [Candidatus Ruthia magnifica str. Cm (Calyptogena magnifica)]